MLFPKVNQILKAYKFKYVDFIQKYEKEPQTAPSLYYIIKLFLYTRRTEAVLSPLKIYIQLGLFFSFYFYSVIDILQNVFLKKEWHILAGLKKSERTLEWKNFMFFDKELIFDFIVQSKWFHILSVIFILFLITYYVFYIHRKRFYESKIYYKEYWDYKLYLESMAWGHDFVKHKYFKSYETLFKAVLLANLNLLEKNFDIELNSNLDVIDVENDKRLSENFEKTAKEYCEVFDKSMLYLERCVAVSEGLGTFDFFEASKLIKLESLFTTSELKIFEDFYYILWSSPEYNLHLRENTWKLIQIKIHKAKLGMSKYKRYLITGPVDEITKNELIAEELKDYMGGSPWYWNTITKRFEYKVLKKDMYLLQKERGKKLIEYNERQFNSIDKIVETNVFNWADRKIFNKSNDEKLWRVKNNLPIDFSNLSKEQLFDIKSKLKIEAWEALQSENDYVSDLQKTSTVFRYAMVSNYMPTFKSRSQIINFPNENFFIKKPEKITSELENELSKDPYVLKFLGEKYDFTEENERKEMLKIKEEIIEKNIRKY